MEFKTYYLKFNGPLHLGNHRPESYESSETSLRSDTLTAAIIAMWAAVGKTGFIEEKKGDPGFTISSAFPFVTASTGELLHFFPRPKLPFPHLEIKDTNNDAYLNEERDKMSISKKIKKIRWVEQKYFEALINGQGNQFPDDLSPLLKGEFLTDRMISSEIMVNEIQNRVVIPRDRQKEDPRPFYMERIHFAENAGLFFMASGEKKFLDRLEEGLSLLQYEGLGTDRNVGNGQFTFHTGEIILKLPLDAEHALNLSLFCPESSDALQSLISKESSFSFIKRGGWITTPEFGTYQKNTVHMFEEGSLFKWNKSYEGGIPNLDLAPKIMQGMQKVYRSGRSIFLPVKI